MEGGVDLDSIILVLKWCNLGLRFSLELCTLAAFAYWGIQTGKGTTMKGLLGGGVVVIAMVVWGIFGSPNAAIPLEGWVHALFEVVFFGLAGLSLYMVGKHTLAVIFSIVVVGNWLLMYMWNQ